MSEDSEEIDLQVAETPVKMIGGIQARRKVQEASGWSLDESEDWLRKGIWNLDPKSWYKPPFLAEYKVQQDNLDRTFPIIPGDEAYSDMNDFDLADICMTEVSLDQAIAASFPTTTPIAGKTTSDIPFLVAAHHVAQHLGVPIDAAKAALSHAISAGAVKAWRPPDEYDPRTKARGRPTASEIARTLLDIEKPRIELGPSRRMYKSDEGDAVVDIASMAEWMIRFGLALGISVDGVAPRDDREQAVFSSDIEGDRVLDWLTTSVDKQGLERTLEAETIRSANPVEAMVAPAVEEMRYNERNAGRKRHKSFGPVMAMAGAWLEDRDYSAGDEITEAVLAELRKAMKEFAQRLEDEDAVAEAPNEVNKRKAPCDETIRKWSHSAMEAHRVWREFRRPPRN